MNYLEALNFIESFPNLDQRNLKKQIEPFMTPSAMSSFAQSIGYSTSVPGLIHITGTKGKGSTASFIHSALNEVSGESGLFICPHIVSYSERMKFGNTQISEDEFAKAIASVKDRIDQSNLEEKDQIAQFYLIISAFLELVNRRKTKWNVVEVGLGGRNDPTNALTNKEVAVFTPIHVEHKEFLGDTIYDITSNKAGIIKENCKVIVAQQENEEVVDLLKSLALENNCPFMYVPEHYNVNDIVVKNGQQIVEIERSNQLAKFKLNMIGKHQAINATTALAVIDSVDTNESLKEPTSDCFIDAALLGRFEILETNPLIIIDGAHTKESAQALWSSVNEFYKFEKAIAIIACGADKEAKSLVSQLSKFATSVFVTQTEHPNCLPKEDLESIAKSVYDKEVKSFQSVKEALICAKSQSQVNDLILITGSLHMQKYKSQW